MDELENINPFQILAKSLTRIEQMLGFLMEKDLNDDSVTPQQPWLLRGYRGGQVSGSEQAGYLPSHRQNISLQAKRASVF